jgi:hypothetical protein
VREECRLRVFESRVLRRIFEPKRDEETRKWKKLHNEELNDLYSSPNIIRVITSRRMGWVGHVASTWERRGVCRVLVGKTRKKVHLEYPGVVGSVILGWIFRTWGVGMDWIGLFQDSDRWRALR